MTKEELAKQIDCIGKIISRDSKQIAENMNVGHIRMITIKAELTADSLATVTYSLERIADAKLFSVRREAFGCHEGK